MDTLSVEDRPVLEALKEQAKEQSLNVDRLAALVTKLVENQGSGQVTTVIHRTEGMGWMGVICAAISFCCLLGILGMGWAVNNALRNQTAEMHDLHAWRDIHQNHISALEAWKQSQEKQK